jgi:ketosteroid isomerase-like protein
MKLFAAIALTAALLAAPAVARDLSAATAEEVRQADIAFAKRSGEVGFARAFREYVDENEGLLYGMDGPPAVGAQAVYEALGGDAPSGVTVDWAPTHAWGAKSGEMGATVGTWRRTYKDLARPARTGRYVTVWRLNAKGEWKALIDIGEADPLPTSPSAATTP